MNTNKTITATTAKNNVKTSHKISAVLAFSIEDESVMLLKQRIIRTFMNEIRYINSVRSDPNHAIRRSNLTLAKKLVSYDFDELCVEYGGLNLSIPVQLADVVEG